MPETAMTISAPAAAHMQVSREWESQLDLIQRTVAPGLTPEEFALFIHVARQRHLDPLQRQIHAVKRATWDAEKGGYVEKMTLQTGIDGYRAIANRTGHYMPSKRLPLVEGAGTQDLRVTAWVEKFSTSDNQWHEFGSTAYYREYVQTRRNKQTNKVEPNSMWEKMPISQLTKCAEALALRRGWPEELGDIYADEEMPSQEPAYLPPENSNLNKTKQQLGTLKISSEPNRGHGNEGTQRTQKEPEREICAECRQVNGHTPDCTRNREGNGANKNPENTANPARSAANPANNANPANPAKKNKREEWETKPGHNPKIHIGFEDGIQLFEIQRKLGITEEQIKQLLDREFEIQHRYLIPKDQFQQVLDAIRDEFGKQAGKSGEDLKGIFAE
jgi:phage recombination protein Bet